MFPTDPTKTCIKWYVIEKPNHWPDKDMPGEVITYHYWDILRVCFNWRRALTCRTVRQDCHSWFLLSIGVATSTAKQIFTDVQIDQATNQLNLQVAKQENVQPFTVQSNRRDSLTEGEVEHVNQSVSPLRVVDIKHVFRQKEIPVSVVNAVLIDKFVQSCQYVVKQLKHFIDILRVFFKLDSPS